MTPFLQKDSTNNWNTVPPVPPNEINNVNCHKFVLYVINRISYEEMVSDPKIQKEAGLDFTFSEETRNISEISFTPVKDVQSLFTLANQKCEIGETYIGQILDVQTGEMAHSFIVKRKSHDEYVCCDKQGFKYPFTVFDLETILDFVNKDGVKSYQNQSWRFVPIKK